jgi:hypothetical protein
MTSGRWELSDDDWAEFQMLRIQVRGLREAVQMTLDWMQGMTIVRGGKRERLRNFLLLALDNSKIERKRTT